MAVYPINRRIDPWRCLARNYCLRLAMFNLHIPGNRHNSKNPKAHRNKFGAAETWGKILYSLSS
jgi:hypothetical protein